MSYTLSVRKNLDGSAKSIDLGQADLSRNFLLKLL